jgi:hydroxyethylthiazole kinase-like uncharacterized protein yjeF
MSIPPLTETVLRRRPLPLPGPDGGKQNRGRVLIAAGSRAVPGAVLLSGVSALRAGAGVLRIATVESRAGALGVAIPEAMVIGLRETPQGDIHPGETHTILELAADADSVLLGPGMRSEDVTQEVTEGFVRRVEGPAVVLDAVACASCKSFISHLRRLRGNIVLTPHAGEMAKLLGNDRSEVEADMRGAGRRAAAETGAVIALKGAETFVVDPQDGEWLFQGGTIALGTSGSGDTLAGIIAGLLARGASPVDATLWGVVLHAEAGRRLASRHGPLGALAREIPAEIPSIMRELSEPR